MRFMETTIGKQSGQKDIERINVLELLYWMQRSDDPTVVRAYLSIRKIADTVPEDLLELYIGSALIELIKTLSAEKKTLEIELKNVINNKPARPSITIISKLESNDGTTQSKKRG